MRKAWPFSFVVLGCTSVIAQVLLIRELLIVFYGNEFFIGWTLFAWLFWCGAGVLLTGRVFAGGGHAARRTAACHAGAALLLPVEIVLIRCRAAWVGAVPGSVPDLLPAMAYTFAALAPIGLVLGGQFILGAHAWEAGDQDTGFGRILGRAYGFETVGFIVGGILSGTFFVVQNEFCVAALTGIMNLLAGAMVLATACDRAREPKCVLAGIAVFLVAMLGFRAPLNHATSAMRFPEQKLLESHNSIYGNIAVTEIARQVNFYENGLLLGTADEQMASEQLVHFPMLWHPAPKRVLLVGTGFNGALAEILKHRPKQVDYVELDPRLVETVETYIAPAQRAALADKRVQTVFADGRAYLAREEANEAGGKYDVVIVNLPNPGTALINRFYSLEFFRDVRRHLTANGVLALRLAFAPDYLSPELGNLGTSIDRTLREAFETVSILPGYEIYYLATPAAGPPPGPDDLIARYDQRGLKTDFVIPPSIRYRLTTDRIGQVQAAFDANAETKLNRDEQPVACYYNFVYWLRSFHPRAAAWAGRAGRIRWPWAAAAVALAAGGMALAVRRRKTYRSGAWAMGIGSFTLMACELAILLSFQVRCGYLYYKLALIIAALMTGMAIGTALGTRCLDHAGPRTLARIHGLVALYAAGFALFSQNPGSWLLESPAAMEWVFLLLAAVIGSLIGFEFPVANRVYLAGFTDHSPKGGMIYGVDLIGSCLGALGIGLWALPVLGMTATLFLLAALNIAAAGLCMKKPAGTVF